jgi:hypothetical protein
MLFAASAEAIDVLMDSAILPVDLVLFKVRTTLTSITLLFYLIATLLIWLNERPRLSAVIVIVYMSILLAVVWIAPSIDLVRLWAMPILFALFITFVITFILAWYWKRLPDVHGLVMSIGVIIAMIGQALKVPLSGIGLTWVSELTDLLGLSILALGLLIRPGYAKAKLAPQTIES